jgi:hypothetical protein
VREKRGSGGGDTDDEEERTGERLAMAKHLEQVKQRIDRGRQEDDERERARIRSLHKEKRMKQKIPRGEEDGSANGSGVQLVPYEEEDGSVGRPGSDDDEGNDFDGVIVQYGLTKNKVYQLSDVNQSAPNSHELIYVIQIDGKIIPHLPEDFYSIDEWREKQIKKILNSN